MNKVSRIISISIFIAALIVIFLMLADPLFNLDLRLVKDNVTASSTSTLVQVRDILALNTVEVVYKVVFPYDYVPADMNWDLFIKQVKDGRLLSPLEESYVEVYRLCEDIGIELDGRDHEFVVVTTILKGGFDLTNPVFRSPESAGELAEKYVAIDSENGIFVFLPDAVITDVIIEDADTGTYTYPDIDIGPEDWKKLTSFVKKTAAADAVDQGILNAAEENGKAFLKRILLDSGYSSVSFAQ